MTLGTVQGILVSSKVFGIEILWASFHAYYNFLITLQTAFFVIQYFVIWDS